MYSFIELLRALAAALITNSHFDGVYPWNISWGGCPGVALFFAISGFLLVRSVEKERFLPWWIKKVIRLYIPLTIVNAITVIIGFRKVSWMLFLFPINTLWYVPVIALLYIPYFAVMRAESNCNKAISIRGGYCGTAIMLTLVIYVISYLLHYKNSFFVEPEVGFRVLYGFIAMLLGAIVFIKRDAVAAKRGWIYMVLSALSCIGFLGAKLLINRISIAMKLQFMTQVFGVSFAIFALIAGLCYEEKIAIFLSSKLGALIGMISKCSLEVFLVQFAIIDFLKPLAFPVNILLIIVAILLVAWVVHIVSDKIYKTLVPLLRFER